MEKIKGGDFFCETPSENFGYEKKTRKKCFEKDGPQLKGANDIKEFKIQGSMRMGFFFIDSPFMIY